MSGKKQFNETQVIDAATRHFWQHGFARSSIHNLESATGLNKSSLYNTFKSKRALFERCLKHFDQTYSSRLMSILATHRNFHRGLEDFFNALLAGLADPQYPSGCLETQAALEMGCRPDTISEHIQRSLNSLQGEITARCALAVQQQQLASTTNTEELAAAIIATSRGAVVMYMASGNAALSRQACNYLLKSLQ